MNFSRPIAAFAVAALLCPPVFAQDQPPLPQPRPEGLGEAEAAPEPGDGAEVSADRIYQAACPALLSGRIVGDMVPPIADGDCGLQSPIAVGALMINGREIALSGAPVTTCAMATTLADWAEAVDAYAGAALDTQVESLSTGPGYTCRLRNGAETGFVSEHGLGNAVDITAIILANGESIAVLDDWSATPVLDAAKFLGFAHGAACGRFTTVLGPAANADHEDHFHFDLGCHGQSCTAQICE